MAKASPPTQKAPSTRRDAVATRAALLDAASLVFSQGGYRQGSVRDICAQAGVNVGAVNSHFGSKKALYHEVVVQAGRSLLEEEPGPTLQDFDTPHQALRGWMKFHLRLVLVRQAADPVANALIASELANPTEALDDFFEFLVRPIANDLTAIVSAVLDGKCTPAQALAASNFVHGVCAFQSIGQHILSRLDQPVPHDEASIEQRLDQLYPMALAGVMSTVNQPTS